MVEVIAHTGNINSQYNSRRFYVNWVDPTTKVFKSPWSCPWLDKRESSRFLIPEQPELRGNSWVFNRPTMLRVVIQETYLGVTQVFHEIFIEVNKDKEEIVLTGIKNVGILQTRGQIMEDWSNCTVAELKEQGILQVSKKNKSIQKIKGRTLLI